MKKLFIGILIGATLMATTSAYADSVKQFILTKVTYPLVVKGKVYADATLPLLNYNGTTYVPLKAVGDLFGAAVKWNADKKQVEIGGSEDIPASTTTDNSSQLTAIKATVNTIITLSKEQNWSDLYTYVHPDIQAMHTKDQFIAERTVNGAAFAGVTNIEIDTPTFVSTWTDNDITHKSYSNVAVVPVKLTINGTVISTTMHLVQVDGQWKYFWSPTSLGQQNSTSNTSIKTFQVNQTVTSGPMTMTIDKVTFDPAYKADQYSDAQHAIILHVKVENTSDNTVDYYPNQGTLVLNTEEQVEADLINSDQVGGEFIGKVVKTGNIVFPIKSDFSQITSLKLQINGASDNDLNTIGQETLTTINLK